ncbi:hypothetical protein JZ751_006339 [Albula glossodonta]|uniref:Ig-like domain-containing protein n=1 Tax=Albula glossodonta TaxID=121402 RepID=A0A8T2NAY9_9TELE|nr:hypothetical protein JZ751_006339 [Albula glossodonta]
MDCRSAQNCAGTAGVLRCGSLQVQLPRDCKAVTISCSVSHTCPSEPPQITWSHNGTLNIQSEQLQPPNGQWKVTSVLTFTPTIADHNKKVTCTAEYPRRSISKSAQASQLLSVKYAPVSVRAETETPVVKEGDSVQLVCSSDSNPKAHSYQWYDVTGSLQSKERILTLQKVPRDTGAFYCTASNSEGSGKSSLVKVHVEYAPEIKEGSACTTTVTGVTCVCIVDSVPPPEIRWLFLGGALPSSRTERHGSISRGTFQNPHRLSDHITCQASTSRGNSTISLPIPHTGKTSTISLPIPHTGKTSTISLPIPHTGKTSTISLPIPHTDKLQYILIAVALLLAAVGVVIWFVRRKRNHDQAVVDKKDEEVSTETATYATTVRLGRTVQCTPLWTMTYTQMFSERRGEKMGLLQGPHAQPGTLTFCSLGLTLQVQIH